MVEYQPYVKVFLLLFIIGGIITATGSYIGKGLVESDDLSTFQRAIYDYFIEPTEYIPFVGFFTGTIGYSVLALLSLPLYITIPFFFILLLMLIIPISENIKIAG